MWKRWKIHKDTTIQLAPLILLISEWRKQTTPPLPCGKNAQRFSISRRGKNGEKMKQQQTQNNYDQHKGQLEIHKQIPNIFNCMWSWRTFIKAFAWGGSKSISNGVQYVILHSTIGWTNSNICRFDSGKWFWLSIIAHVAVAGKRRSNTVHLQKECNKYDVTAAQCFWSAHHNDWSRWFAICCPSFSFIGGVAKEYITKLGCEK